MKKNRKKFLFKFGDKAIVTRKKKSFLLLLFLLFFAKPIYSHSPEALGIFAVIFLLIIVFPICARASYLLKTKIFEYGFGKENSISDTRLIFISSTALEAVFTLFFYITYIEIQPNTPVAVIIKTIILITGYFLFAVKLNYVLIKKRVAPAVQDATMSADRIRIGGKIWFFCKFLQGISKKKICRRGDTQNSNRVFKFSIYLSLIYPLVFVIFLTILVLSIIYVKL